MSEHYLTTPLSDEAVEQLRIGDTVYLTGVIYTGRDAAHKRLVDALDAGNPCLLIPRVQLSIMLGRLRPSPAMPSAQPGQPPATVWIPMRRV